MSKLGDGYTKFIISVYFCVNLKCFIIKSVFICLFFLIKPTTRVVQTNLKTDLSVWLKWGFQHEYVQLEGEECGK